MLSCRWLLITCITWLNTGEIRTNTTPYIFSSLQVAIDKTDPRSKPEENQYVT